MLTVEAPAKINLTLEVLGIRTDGYHEIRSVIQTLSFCDTLQITPGKEINFKGNMTEWSSEQSLVIKAVKLLKEATGCTKGAKIKIKKRIPLISGLGGDSSDAASLLRGLNEFWELNIPPNKLRDMAQNLGSDVSFFLTGGTALMAGRGETITALPPVPHQWVILIVPDVSGIPGKTKRLYNMLQPSHFTDGKITDKLVTDLKSGAVLSTSLLFNTFENVVFTRGEELTDYRDHLLKLGAPNVHLAGSGPTLFILLDKKPQAEELLQRLQDRKMEAYLTETRNCL
ncbi:MAG: 4-(cytidine 5'-diphospho)-2-C-methyl-D-erythritol kinase [Dehalococcoidales bacterium]